MLTEWDWAALVSMGALMLAAIIAGIVFSVIDRVNEHWVRACDRQESIEVFGRTFVIFEHEATDEPETIVEEGPLD